MLSVLSNAARSLPLASALVGSAVLLASASASAWPTQVRLTRDVQFTGEGTYVVLTTNKGTVTASGDEAGVSLYQPFVAHPGRKGECYVLETESESDVVFNKGPNQSLTRSIRKVPCK